MHRHARQVGPNLRPLTGMRVALRALLLDRLDERRVRPRVRALALSSALTEQAALDLHALAKGAVGALVNAYITGGKQGLFGTGDLAVFIQHIGL